MSKNKFVVCEFIFDWKTILMKLLVYFRYYKHYILDNKALVRIKIINVPFMQNQILYNLESYVAIF